MKTSQVGKNTFDAVSGSPMKVGARHRVPVN